MRCAGGARSNQAHRKRGWLGSCSLYCCRCGHSCFAITASTYAAIITALGWKFGAMAPKTAPDSFIERYVKNRAPYDESFYSAVVSCERRTTKSPSPGVLFVIQRARPPEGGFEEVRTNPPFGWVLYSLPRYEAKLTRSLRTSLR